LSIAIDQASEGLAMKRAVAAADATQLADRLQSGCDRAGNE
jgi:hypothetical protein